MSEYTQVYVYRVCVYLFVLALDQAGLAREQPLANTRSNTGKRKKAQQRLTYQCIFLLEFPKYAHFDVFCTVPAYACAQPRLFRLDHYAQDWAGLGAEGRQNCGIH